MIDELSSTQSPSGIRICQDDSTTGTLASGIPLLKPVIGGFQMMYGTGSSRVVGPAHGDVSVGTCVEKNFPTTPSAVNIYTDETAAGALSPTLMGIRLLFDIAGQDTPASISLGATEVVDLTKYEYTFAATDQY